MQYPQTPCPRLATGDAIPRPVPGHLPELLAVLAFPHHGFGRVVGTPEILVAHFAKAMSGFGSAGVSEVVEDYRSGTYRAVYTVKFSGWIYVLHCFQKKSKSGIKTPKEDVALITARLKAAKQDYEFWQRQHGAQE